MLLKTQYLFVSNQAIYKFVQDLLFGSI